MAMDIGAKSGVRSDINITPLVDVVLVLLIIFMVITPMLQRGKHVELPKARHAAKGQSGPEPLFISVTTDGKATEYGAVRPVLDRASKAKLKGVQLAAEELKGK
jgi:biopolymer transport protein ExbD